MYDISWQDMIDTVEWPAQQKVSPSAAIFGSPPVTPLCE